MLFFSFDIDAVIKESIQFITEAIIFVKKLSINLFRGPMVFKKPTDIEGRHIFLYTRSSTNKNVSIKHMSVHFTL